jgi:signal transduction histidine kinase
LTINAQDCTPNFNPNKLDTTHALEREIKAAFMDKNILNSIQKFEAIVQNKSLDLGKFFGKTHILLANRYKNIQEYQKALSHIAIAKKWSLENCPELLLDCYATLSIISWRKNEYDLALKYRLKSKSYAKNLLDTLVANYNLLSLFDDLGDTTMAKKYISDFHKIKNLYPKKIPPMLQYVYQIMELNYTGDLKKNEQIIQQLKAFSKKTNDYYELQLLVAEANAYLNFDSEKSFHLYQKLLYISDSLDQEFHIATAQIQLIDLFIKKNQFNKAMNLFEKIQIKNFENDWKMEQYLMAGFKIHHSLNHFEESNEYAKKLLNYKDSIAIINNKKEYAKWSIKYQTEKKIQEAKILASNLLLKKQEIEDERNSKLWLILIVTITIITLILLYSRYLQKIKYSEVIQHNNQLISEKNEALEKENKTKNRLFSMISHDLLSPYNALLFHTKKLRNELNHLEDKHIDKSVSQIQNAVKVNHRFVQELLTWAKLNNEQINISPSNFKLKLLVLEVLAPFNLWIQDKKIQLNIEIPLEVYLIYDRNLLSIILSNLLSNAVKNTEKNGKITIRFYNKEDSKFLQIYNSGSGLSKEEIDKIRSKINWSSEPEKKGLGISICEDIAEVIGGKLRISSNFGTGTTVEYYF